MSGAVPQLRFPGFAGDWEEALAGDLFEFRNGLNYLKDADGDEVKVVGVGDFQNNEAIADYSGLSVVAVDNAANDSILLRDGDILFVRSNGNKDLIGRTMIVQKLTERVAYSGFTIRGRITDDGLSPEFAAKSFRAHRFRIYLREMGGGTNISNLSQDIISGYSLFIPFLAEQQKIADFLGTVDAKLEALRRKKSGLEAFKLGLMQRLFSQTLSFTRDDGTDFPDWEERELAEIGERSKDKNKDLEINRVLTNSATLGIIDQGDYFDKDIANAESLSGYYIARFGDYVYNPRISVSAPVGPINRNNLADGVMSPLYTVFRINDGVNDFFAQYFSSNFWHDYMKSIANYGARHDRMAIGMADFMAMPLPWPHPDEQRKIADALSALDAKIAAVADQITHMEAFKKGLLQQMFV